MDHLVPLDSERSVPEHSDAIYLQSLNKSFSQISKSELAKISCHGIAVLRHAASSTCWFLPPVNSFQHDDSSLLYG